MSQRILAFIFCIFIISLSACSPIQSRHGTRGSNDMRYVCHKGKKTLTLPANAIQGHLNHGDRLGRCY